MAPQPIPPTPPQKPAETAPKTSSALDPGQTAIDDKVAIEVELACYQELHVLAAEIRRRVERKLPSDPGPSGRDSGFVTAMVSEARSDTRVHLFFLDQTLRFALDIASTLKLQLKNLRDAYEGAANTASAGLHELEARQDETKREKRERGPFFTSRMPMLPSVGEAAVALLGALKSDTRYVGRQVVIPEQAFALTLAHEWEDSPTVSFHYPTLFVPPTDRRDDLMEDFIAAFDAVVDERKTAAKALSTLLSAVSRMKPDAERFPAAKAALDSARDQFQAAEAVFENVSSKLTTADEKTGLTQLQLVQRAAFVDSISRAATGRTFYLFAQAVSAGGAFRISRNILRMLFWGDGLEHSGGCIVTFALFNDVGDLRAADTIGTRSSYTNSRPPQQAGSIRTMPSAQRANGKTLSAGANLSRSTASDRRHAGGGISGFGGPVP